MRLYTQRERIREVARRWHQTYRDVIDGRYPDSTFLPKVPIYQALSSLDLETATADQVNKIIGNTVWTDIECAECERKVTTAVVVGRDHESLCLCLDCARLAVAAFALKDGEQ